MVEWALVIVVAVHLLAVNLAVAGPMVAAVFDWRILFLTRNAARDQSVPPQSTIDVQNREFREVAFLLAKWSILAAAIGFGIGLFALGFLIVAPRGDSRYLQAILNVVPDRWWFMAGEILFYFVCMLFYSMFNRAGRWRWWLPILPLAAGTNLLYHFPAFFTILAIIATRPDLQGATLNKILYHQLLWDPETLARVVHIWLASFAVTGFAVCWIGQRIAKLQAKPPEPAAIKSGGRIALTATILQIPVGVWVLLALDENQQARLMAGDLSSTAVFGTAIVVALAMMHHLAMLALGDLSRRRLMLATVLLFGTVFLMTAALRLSRG